MWHSTTLGLTAATLTQSPFLLLPICTQDVKKQWLDGKNSCSGWTPLTIPQTSRSRVPWIIVFCRYNTENPEPTQRNSALQLGSGNIVSLSMTQLLLRHNVRQWLIKLQIYSLVTVFYCLASAPMQPPGLFNTGTFSVWMLSRDSGNNKEKC